MHFLVTFIMVYLTIGSVLAAADDFRNGAEVVFGNTTDGYGKIIWPEGQPKGISPGKTYEGYFTNGLPNGYGKVFFPATGCIFLGEFKNGKEHGIGVVRWPDGQGYTGAYQEGKPSGTGISVSTNGTVRIANTHDDIGLTLLATGELEREDIYMISPTLDNQSTTGFFIPANLDDCFQELQRMLTSELIEEMRVENQEEMNRYHSGLGRWMRNHWKLGGESQISKWFKSQGIEHPDDMSGIILTSFWRHLNDKAIELDEQLKSYQQSK